MILSSHAADDPPSAILTKTPFHMRDGWDFFLENKNTTCSHAEIDVLIQKRIINLIDIELIKTLARFPFTNLFNITFYMNHSGVLHPNYQKNSYLANLNKLRKAGIVARYRYAYMPYPNVDRPAESSLRLYSLTPPALSYIKPVLADAHTLPMASDSLRKLEIAALNQFLIHFQVAYTKNIKQSAYLLTTKNGVSPFIIDAIIQYRSQNPALHMAGDISLILLSVREAGSWIPHTVHRLKQLHTYISRSKYRLPFYLILAENVNMIVDLYPYLQEQPFSGLPFYFSIDTTACAYPPLDSIFFCQQSDEDSSVTAVRNTIIL